MMDCFVRIDPDEFPKMLTCLELLKMYWEEKSIDSFMEYNKWKQKPFYKRIFEVSPEYKVQQAEEMVSRMKDYQKMFRGSRAVYIEHWLYHEILHGFKRHSI